MSDAGRAVVFAVAFLAAALMPATLSLADGGNGYDPSMEPNPRNSPVPNASPNDERIYRNPEQKAAEFGYSNLNDAAFLLFFDKTTRFNMFTGRTEVGKVTFFQSPIVPTGNEYLASPAGQWASEQAYTYFERKYAEERKAEQKHAALAAGKSVTRNAKPTTTPAKLAPANDQVGTSVSFRWSQSASLSLRADYKQWSDNNGLSLNQIRYSVHPFGLSQLRGWGSDSDNKPDVPAESKNEGLRPEAQTRDEIGKGNILFEIDLKKLFRGDDMTRLDPPTPGLLDDPQDWDSAYNDLNAGGWSGTLDMGNTLIMPRYYFTPTPAQETIPDGKLVDSFSYDLDFKLRDGMTVPVRGFWKTLDTPASNELAVGRITLGVRYDY